MLKDISEKLNSGKKIIRIKNVLVPCSKGEPVECYGVDYEGSIMPEEEHLEIMEKDGTEEEYETIPCYKKVVTVSDFTITEIEAIEFFLKKVFYAYNSMGK